mgnify:CR=1 FL=1
MNKKSISLILGLMCMALTFGIAVQIKTVNGTGTTVSTNSKENELRDAVLKAKEKYDNLYEDLERMESQLEAERTNSTQNNTELAELENTIKEGNKVLGLSEVTGDGIIITLNDSQTNNWYMDPNELIVHDIDLIKIVNELKSVGAEAISINGQRIITTSAIECDGNVIMINGEKIGAPFEIKAIGFPETLININIFGGYVYHLREERSLEVTVAKSDKEKITIPKYSGVIKYEYLQSQ